MKVLVVDDNEQLLNLLEAALTDAGHEVVKAANGEQAQEIFNKTMPELVITDIVMPEIDGIELLLSLKQINPDMKIIAISGGNSGYGDSYLRMAGKLGASAILHKPFEMAELVKIVKGFEEG